MWGSMVGIQSATAENRRGKKEDIERKKKPEMKIKCPHLLCRAAITNEVMYLKQIYSSWNFRTFTKQHFSGKGNILCK